MLSVIYAKCHLQARYVYDRYDECRYSEYHYAECHGASFTA